MGVMTDILIGAVGSLVAVGVYDCLPRFSGWLVERASAQLPNELRQRYGEEWQAYLNDWDGNIGKFLAAVGFVWTGQRLLEEWHAERDPTNRMFVRFAYFNAFVYCVIMWSARHVPFFQLWILVQFGLMGLLSGDGLVKTGHFLQLWAEEVCAPLGQSHCERRAKRRVRVADLVRKMQQDDN
jgi:hypothetical protein